MVTESVAAPARATGALLRAFVRKFSRSPRERTRGHHFENERSADCSKHDDHLEPSCSETHVHGHYRLGGVIFVKFVPIGALERYRGLLSLNRPLSSPCGYIAASVNKYNERPPNIAYSENNMASVTLTDQSRTTACYHSPLSLSSLYLVNF